MLALEDLFGQVELSICVPASASPSSDLSALLGLPRRSEAFYDESLRFLLTARVSTQEHALSRAQAARLFSSPALEIVAEVGYADSTASGPPSATKASASGVPFTPLPQPDSNQADALFAAAQVSNIWHTTFSAEQGLMNVIEQDDGWTGIWAFDTTVSLTCTLTLKLGLDAGLKNIFTFEERPPSPPAKTPLRTNKNRLSGSAFPRTTPPAGYPRAATPPAGIYSRSQNRSSSPALRPADKFDPEKEERRTKGAAARRKRSQQEEYAFAGFEDVNLLDSAGQALDLPEDIGHFPSSRLHPAVTSASIGVTSTSRGLDPQFGHARRHSRAQSAGNAAEAWPTLRRSHRKTLKVHSAIHLRIRPLETPISLPQDRQDFDDEFVSQIGTTLSVEVENNRHTGMGFEIDAIWVEVHMATASSTPKRLPFLFPGQKAAVTRLQRNDQHDFLFALKAADVLEEDATAAGSEQPHTPISAVSNLRQILSGPLQQRAVAQGNEDSRFPPEQPQQNRTMAMHRTVCVVVRGRPVYLAGANAMDQALPNALHVPVTHPRPGAAALPTYFTAAFDSRWNCSLDLTSLATRREEKRSSIVSTRPESRPPSTTRSNSMPINSNMSTPVVGSKRYSMSNLPSAAGKRTSMQDIPLGGPSSAIPSDIPDVYAIKRASGPPVHHNRMEALREDSVVGESPLPTPAFPPYSSTRPEADFVEALSQSPAPQQLLLPDRPAIIAAGAQYGNAGSGLLVHVSLVKPPAEITRLGSPKASRSQAMAHTVSAASAASAMSTSADQSHPRITLLEPFQIEVFVINRTASEKRLQVGVPTRKALPTQRRQHLASSRAGNPGEAERSEDSGVVPLDNHAQIGPLAAGACQSVRLKFVALSTGTLWIEELQLIDLDTGRETRLRRVLTVVAS